MVEIAFFARRAKLTVEQTLLKLREAGVDSMPGGGAEISPNGSASSSATTTAMSGLKRRGQPPQNGLAVECKPMLYGHIENDEDRVDHLLKLRRLGARNGRLSDLHPVGVSPGKQAA